jgi:serine phosphatase RsbU (regulator of sigma subunit)/anti-sigma regulatory factor (Ser/Thr protein kinase)
MATAAEMVLGNEPDAVPHARRFAREALAGERRMTIEDAELIVSELVTNAVLHGRAPATLRVSRTPEKVRVEVEDASRDLPVRMRSSDEAMTGRGLDMIAALASSWGVEVGPTGGKIVWAELTDAATTAAVMVEPKADVDPEALLASWPDDEPSEPIFTVELGSVPTDLLLAAKAHIDNLVREFTLAQAGNASSSGTQVPSRLSELVQTVVYGFAIARSSIKRQALAAADRGEVETRLTLTLPLSAADAGEQYLAALDEADRYARAARLLTLETPPVHRIFRRWYVESLVDQLRRQANGRPAVQGPTFPQRLGDEVTKLAPLQVLAARLTLLQQVTAELTGADEVADIAATVVRHATAIFGAHAARIYLLGKDGILRSEAADGGGDAALARDYEEFPAAADLPGGVALRTRKPVVLRDLTDLAKRFPQLAGAYPDERTLLVAPLVVGDHELGVLSLTFRGPSNLDQDTQMAFLTTLADVTAQAVERALAAAAAVQASERLSFLAEGSVILASSLDYLTVLGAVADLVVPRLADWCVVQLLEGDSLQTVALSHFDPAKVTWANQYADRYPTDMNAPTGAPNVIRTGNSELYPHIPEELLVAAAVNAEHLGLIQELGISSALIVPLTGRGGTFGAVTMIYAESGGSYGPDDVTFAEDLARRAALAVETAHAFREQSGRLAEVTRIAEMAQHAILAPPPAQMGPVALSARYVSAAAEALIGGDMYEVLRRPGAVRLLIGDVRGKGLDAVRTTTIVLGEFRAAAADLNDLAEVAAQIDRRLRPYLGDEDFVTALLAEITDDGAFSVASCGHPSALIAANGSISEIETQPSLPLGLGATPSLSTGRLAVGDRLLLYTDGLLEARDSERQFVNLAEMVKPLTEGDVDEVLDGVLAGLLDVVGGVLADDLALLVAEFRGASPHPRPLDS